MKPTEQIATTARRPQRGFVATLRGLFGVRGTGASTSREMKGTGAPSSPHVKGTGASNPPAHPRPYAALGTEFYRRLGTLLASVSLLAGIFVAATPTPALAAAPETPFTRAAKSITGTTAVLHGELNPKAADPLAPLETEEYQFAYAPSSSECTAAGGVVTTPAMALGEKEEKVSTTPPVTGLEGSTEYAFCVVAINTPFGGSAEPSSPPAAPLTFKTLAAKPAVVVGSEKTSAVTPVSATLEAEVNPENQPTTSCVFEYGETLPSGKSAPCAPSTIEGPTVQGVSANISGLNANKTYHYLLVVKNATGEAEGTGEFTTPVAEAPKVENVHGGSVTPFAASLEAEVNPEYQTTSCEIEWGKVVSEHKENCVPPTLQGSGNQGVSLPVKGLEPSKTYHFRVVAKNATGENPPAEGEFTTLPKEAPTVGNVHASEETPFSATIDAEVNPEFQTTSCEIEWGEVVTEHKEPCVPSTLEGSGNQGVSLPVKGLKPGTIYHINVKAENTAHEKGEAPGEFKTPALAKPVIESESSSHVTPFAAKLEATVNPEYQKTKVTFEYADEAQGGEEGLLKGQGTKVSAAEIPALGGGQPVSVHLTALTAHERYYFRVVATNATGTAENTGVIQKFETLPAEAPKVESESAVAITSNDAQLEAQINPEYQATTYTFEYSTQGEVGGALKGAIVKVPGAFVLPASSSEQTAGPVDLSGALASGTKYFYRVLATNAAGTTDGPVENFTTQPAPSVPTEQPWFHLTSGARPTNLPVGAGSGTSEVQEIVATSTVNNGEPVTFLEAQIEGKSVQFDGKSVEFATEPWLKNFLAENPQDVGLIVQLNTANLQQALEESGYGPVTVTETEEEPTVGTSVKHFFLKSRGFAPAPQLGVLGSPPPKDTVTTAASFQGSHITVTAANLGDAPTSGETTIVDTLPAGLEAVAAEGISGLSFTSNGTVVQCSVQSPQTVKCTSKAPLPPFALIEVDIGVNVEPAAKTGEQNTVGVSGGGAHSVQVSHPITVSGQATPFGVQSYELNPEQADGSPDAQAGSHPFQVTGTLQLNQTAEGESAALAKDVTAKIPPGLIGNPTVFPRCTISQFFNQACKPESTLGVAMITIKEPTVFTSAESHGIGTFTLPIVNLEPSPGEAARFGFNLPGIAPVFVDITVGTGADYGVRFSSSDISEIAGFTGFNVTIWGVPEDARHNYTREHALQESGLHVSETPAFLVMPTSCANPLQSSIEVDSWPEPHNRLSFGSLPMETLDGCNHLSFGPSIKVAPDVEQASKPSGLTVDVHVPQTTALNPSGLASSNIRTIKVKLPQGVSINPADANGLQACSEGLVGFEGFHEYEPEVKTPRFTAYLPGSVPALAAGDSAAFEPGVDFCSDASKIASVKIKTPLLPNPLEGAVYLASQEQNPFDSLLAMYIVAEDPVSGSLVKLPGTVSLNETTGQIESTFEDNPQLAFEDAELHFFGGERAPLSTPSHCGTYTTEAEFTPWSGETPVTSTSSFQIISGPNGSACPGSSLPFSPSATAGSSDNQAGEYTPFTFTMSRADGEQNLQSGEVKLPEGLSGVLSNIELCPEPQANQGLCGPNSLIGETTVSVGVGGQPYTVTGGRVYLTGPYNGSGGCSTPGSNGCAPFGLSIVNPAKAGPFDLANTKTNKPPCDCVLVRAKIELNPLTSAVTISSNLPGTTDSIPTILGGIPLQIQHVNVTTTRSDFQFNPTNCSKLQAVGVLHAAEGGVDTIGVPFQATNCAALKFEPKFSVSTSGKTSKAKGASLTAKVTEPKVPQGTDADIAKVKVELPLQLPSRLTTLQKACTDAQFEANPAGCPSASDIGHAVVHTPLIPVPLEGPAIFVSHGGEAFPSLEIVLQGYGIKVILVGTTFISKSGITSTTFKTVPDQPFSTFELTLPQGPYSALAANGNLCKEASKLIMPNEFIGQNGAAIHQNTKIAVTGCKKVKTLTRAQKLKAALKACHKKKNKAKREACERTAHKRYGPVKKANKGKK